jgi:hypothetical protein
VRNDFSLIFENCKEYNEPGAAIAQDAKKVQQAGFALVKRLSSREGGAASSASSKSGSSSKKRSRDDGGASAPKSKKARTDDTVEAEAPPPADPKVHMRVKVRFADKVQYGAHAAPHPPRLRPQLTNRASLC